MKAEVELKIHPNLHLPESNAIASGARFYEPRINVILDLSSPA
jgi:hypothetical protein